jgi:rubrerythrin
MGEEINLPEEKQESTKSGTNQIKGYFCDRCGFKMIEKNCKIECPNCGNRFDCSDLNIYFD